jgi:hypothetical protein
MSYFGVDATYACGIAIVRAILHAELERCGGEMVRSGRARRVSGWTLGGGFGR